MGQVSYLLHTRDGRFIPVYRMFDPEPEPVDSDDNSNQENETK